MMALLRLVPVKFWLHLALYGALIVAVFVSHWQGEQAGSKRVQAQWDQEHSRQQAILDQQIQHNADLAKHYEGRYRALEQERQNDIAEIKRTADQSRTRRLRLPPATCPQSPGPADTPRPETDTADASGPVLLPEPIERDLRAMTLQADLLVADCRAAWRFIHENGFNKD